MIGLLVDHNIERHARLLWGQFSEPDWRGMHVAGLATLVDAGIDPDASDRDLWLFCQDNGLLLLTANRNMDGDDSLEAVIRQSGTDQSLPVLTLSHPDRVLLVACTGNSVLIGLPTSPSTWLGIAEHRGCSFHEVSVGRIVQAFNTGSCTGRGNHE
jgi:hypothetical protein